MNRMGHILVNSTEGERAVRKNTQKLGILAAAVASIGLGSLAHAQNNDLLYDWKATNTATTPVTGYTPAPPTVREVGGGKVGVFAVVDP